MSPHCEQGGRLPGLVPDAAPRVTCPWWGRRDRLPPWSPHTHLLMDWLADLARGLSLMYTFTFRLLSRLAPLLALSKVSGDQEPDSSGPVGSTNTTHLHPAPNSDWGLLGKSGCCCYLPHPNPPDANSVASPSEAHSHSNASSLAFRMLLRRGPTAASRQVALRRCV